MAMFHDWFYLVLILVGESEMVAELLRQIWKVDSDGFSRSSASQVLNFPFSLTGKFPLQIL